MSSAVWKLFSRVDKASEKASCNSCGKEYVCKGGTTSNLINHLKSKHKELFEQYLEETKAKATPAKRRPADEPIQAKMKQRKLHDCIPESDDALNRAIEDAIIDFLADAGVAFNVVGLDSFKKLMEIANRRIKLKHPATYSKMVKLKANEIRQELLDIITAVKGDLTCVGFTTDMWTSCAGNPFMSLTCHFIDKDWELHRWTPFVSPFPARHTGKNIALGLDAMLDELGLDSSDWDLFVVNDNASNVKLGIKLTRHLKQYLCCIHTLELGVKDTFKNVLGMTAVLKKTKALGKFTHESTVATDELKKEAIKENIPFRKIANPPNTRWSGRLENLKSVLHLKKSLQNLAATNENWADHSLTASEWKLVEGAVVLLQPVKDTIKAWETEKEPTMHRVVERIYSMHFIIDGFINNPINSRYGIGFARELKRQIEVRFPDKGTGNKLNRLANYLSPQFKGIHLEDLDVLEETKLEVEAEVDKMMPANGQPEIQENHGEPIEEESVPTSPTTKLRNKMQARQQQMRIQLQHHDLTPPIKREMLRYESFSLPPKDVNILKWWKDHEKVLPLLAKLAKKVLTIPASSSKSERVFSAGGNFVTKRRNKLAPKKVEDLIMIKENKSRIEAFKAKGIYELVRIERNPFRTITVDEVIAGLVEENQEEQNGSDVFNHEHDENCGETLFFINDDSDEEYYSDDEDDLLNIAIID